MMVHHISSAVILNSSATTIFLQQSIKLFGNLIAHLVKLIPGRREKWLLGLIAEWHEA